MQLSDIFKNTNATEDVLDDLKFQEYLRWLSELPEWKKKEVEKIIRQGDFSFGDLKRVIDVER